MGDGFQHKKGVATPGRNASTPEASGTPGKRTLVELCYESGPTLEQMMQQFRDRPVSALEGPPLSREEIEQKIAERLARSKQEVIGELPLGGWLVAPRDQFEQAVRDDERRIAKRTLDAATSTVAGAAAAAVGTARGESSIAIMRRAEAAAVLEQVAKAAAAGVKPTSRGGDDRDSARGAPLEPEAHRPGPQRAPTLSELPRITLGPVPPIRPGVPIPKSQLPPRDKTLVDDLKLRSVPTLRNGDKNPAFDELTPRFIAGHFKSEQRRTGSDDPRDWRAPKGYQAQHPNGRPYARYGEPPGTKLTWGTIHDNRDLQKPREFGQTPHARPKPLPGK